MIRQERMTVVRQVEIAHHIYELVLQGEIVQDMNPGQFVHVRVSDSFEPLLRRPISIASIDCEASECTIIYRAEGRGTQILSQKQVGDEVDVLGPLGNGFSAEAATEGGTALLVGGGIGVPPLYELSKQLNARGVRTIHVFGFATENVTFYEEQFSALGETHFVTVDGTKGTKGFVTDLLEELQPEFDVFYSCGPLPMLRALEQFYPEKPGFLSFEERMGCGIGACFACICKTTENTEKDYVKVCSDGPVFPKGVVEL
ncbi:dihydroorotate dehydrogenase electron transfer subunit [Lysinibacillus composti]|uniref:Dihydroorotate dehydrogenase B (NAD(+)), electron transfer subunit n=1 Tax=Lysinibacillus composti TaxID=720633 RepID=A0A3N9UFU4_9BACI|nr:dihydroorotate dehydrogenase electron transfer subunit [Lysinibacillus composti]MBM7608294.1 dihydroorotate dehydrogenase electron transfer subunit [Lysinibacillus composti]RQW75024.1 dihydroorotate dehydrogenase electron transfer subunit [Lysinibacillus composti]